MLDKSAGTTTAVGLAWFRVAVVYFVIAVGLGIAMGMSDNFSLVTVHVHLNLLGWEALALIGLIYHCFPAVGRNRTAKAHFWIHNLALPVMMLALVAKVRGAHVDPVLGASSLVVGIAIVLFAINVLANARARSAA